MPSLLLTNRNEALPANSKKPNFLTNTTRSAVSGMLKANDKYFGDSLIGNMLSKKLSNTKASEETSSLKQNQDYADSIKKDLPEQMHKLVDAEFKALQKNFSKDQLIQFNQQMAVFQKFSQQLSKLDPKKAKSPEEAAYLKTLRDQAILEHKTVLKTVEKSMSHNKKEYAQNLISNQQKEIPNKNSSVPLLPEKSSSIGKATDTSIIDVEPIVNRIDKLETNLLGGIGQLNSSVPLLPEKISQTVESSNKEVIKSNDAIRTESSYRSEVSDYKQTQYQDSSLDILTDLQKNQLESSEQSNKLLGAILKIEDENLKLDKLKANDKSGKGILDKFLDKDGGKGKPKGKLGKIANKVGGLKGALTIGGGVLAAGISGFSKYDELKDRKDLTTGQKTAQVGATAVGSGAGAVIGGVLGSALGPVGTMAGAALGGYVGEALGSSAGELMSDFMASDTYKAVASNFSEIGSAVVGFASTVSDTVSKGASAVGSAVSGTVSAVWGSVSSTASSIASSVSTGIASMFGSVSDFASKTSDMVTGAVKNVWAGISDFGNKIGEGAKALWDGLTNTASNAWDAIKSTAGNAISGAKNLASSVGGAISNGASSVWSGAKNIAGSVGSAVSSAASSATNAASSAVSAVGSFIGKGFKTLTGVNYQGVNPAVKAKFEPMAAEYKAKTGKDVNITSGYRSIEEQAKLYATKPAGQAAKPGSSLHNFGYAMDISSQDANQMESMGLLAKYGFHRPLLAKGETWHIEPVGINKEQIKSQPQFSQAIQRVNQGTAQKPANDTGYKPQMAAIEGVDNTTLQKDGQQAAQKKASAKSSPNNSSLQGVKVSSNGQTGTTPEVAKKTGAVNEGEVASALPKTSKENNKEVASLEKTKASLQANLERKMALPNTDPEYINALKDKISSVDAQIASKKGGSPVDALKKQGVTDPLLLAAFDSPTKGRVTPLTESTPTLPSKSNSSSQANNTTVINNSSGSKGGGSSVKTPRYNSDNMMLNLMAMS